MKFLKTILFMLCYIIGLSMIVQAADKGVTPETEDPNILIYSESHTPTTVTRKKKGVLKLNITAFDPIQMISINDQRFPVSGDSISEIAFPYSLHKGDNSFLITVGTDKGKQQKTFMMTYGKKKKKKLKKPFQLIVKTDISSLDNVTSTADEDAAKSDTKLTLTLVPIYSIPMGKTSTLRFRGIVLREKYSKSDFAANEVSYTQLFAQWLEKKTMLGDVNAGIGYADIRTNNDNPALGEDETLTEIALSAGLDQALTKEWSWNLNMDIKSKDSKAEVTSANDEADAREIGLDVGARFKQNSIDGSGAIGYADNDAKGDYQDSATVQYRLKAGYSIGEFVPKLELVYKEKTRKNDNAANVKQKDKTTTATIKLDYKWKVLAGSQWGLSWKSKKQTSNVSTAEHSATITTLGFTYVF